MSGCVLDDVLLDDVTDWTVDEVEDVDEELEELSDCDVVCATVLLVVMPAVLVDDVEDEDDELTD